MIIQSKLTARIPFDIPKCRFKHKLGVPQWMSVPLLSKTKDQGLETDAFFGTVKSKFNCSFTSMLLQKM